MRFGCIQSAFFIALLVGALHSEALAQQKIFSSQEVFDQGLRKEKSSPKVAFNFFQRAAALAQNHDETLFFKAVVKAASLGFSLEGEDEQKAFNLFRHSIRSIADHHPNDLMTGDLFYFGGVWYKYLVVQPDSAMLCFEKALSIWKDISQEWTDKTEYCYRSMGDIYKYSLYDFDAAERCYEKSLEITEKIDPKNEHQLARIYFSLAATNRSQKDFEKSLSYAFRTIELGRKLNDVEFIDATYSILGNIYRDMGRYDSARHLYELAISSNRRSNRNRPNEMLAAFYQGLGEVLKKEEKYEEAILNYNHGLKIFSTIDVQDINILLHCQEQLGEIYAITGQSGKALDLYRHALRLQTSSNHLKSGSAAALYRRIGDLFQSGGQYDSALYYYQRSLTSAVRKFNSKDFHDNPELVSIELNSYVYEALLGKANILIKIFRRSKIGIYAQDALLCYSLAEKVLAEARNSLDMEEAKWAYLDANFELYERSIEVVYELLGSSQLDSLLDVASYYFEASKSRSLAEEAQVAESYNQVISSDTLIQKSNDYKGSLFRLQDQLNKTKDNARIRSIRNSIVDLDRKLKVNEREIKKKYPSFFDTKYEHHVPSLSDMQSLADRENAVLLEYFWGNRFVYALGITDDKVIFKRIGTIDSLVSNIGVLITFFQPERSSIDLKSYQSFTNAAFELYRQLLQPFQSLTDDKQRIVVVPDGMIGQVPFEVLISRRPDQTFVDYKALEYVVNEKTIGYAFSSAMLLRKNKRVISNPRLLAFGLTGGKSIRSGQDAATESGGASLELSSLSKQFPSGQFYLGDKATKRDFMRNAPAYDLIHLAVHGQGNTEMNYAASLFFKSGGDSISESELHWYELYGMKLNAILAVLSSCESGIGKSYKGEGMLSMANAFVNSGCDNMVMGLWKVNDQVSIQLMEKFYSGLLDGKRIDEALTEGKRDYLAAADEFSAHPKMWGALVAYGNQPVIKNEKGKWISITLLSVVFIISLLFGRRLWLLVSRRLDITVRGGRKHNIP